MGPRGLIINQLIRIYSALVIANRSSRVTGPLPPKGVLSAALALSLLLCVKHLLTETLYFPDVFVCTFVDRTPVLILETSQSA